jgi:elongation factor 1-alpha
MEFHLPQENEMNNIEYKRLILNDNKENLFKLGCQILRRINSDNNEGYCSGEALYYIGIEDDGSISSLNKEDYEKSVQNLDKILNNINCVKRELSHKIYNGSHVGEFLIREKICKTPIEITILMGGSIDAGKSTSLGCLISGEKDNGRGKSRLNVLSNKDEILTGRTMVLSHHILGLDSSGNPCRNINYSWEDITSRSSKIIKFLDLAGHEKYSKTTYKGYVLMKANICFIIVGANMGLNNITKEHIFLCLNLKIPFCFVITKIDICKDRKNVLEDTINEIKKIINLPSIRKKIYNIQTEEDVITCSKNIYSLSIVPIFKISNVTFEGVDILINFLNLIPNKKFEIQEQHGNKIEVLLDSTFCRKGISCIVGGQLVIGKIKIGQELFLGPDSNGNYKKIGIKSIHYNRMQIEKTFNNSYYCMSLKNIKKSEVRKGMVLVSHNPICFYEFKAQIHVHQANKKSSEKTRFNRTTTIKLGYQPTVIVMNIRQNAKILSIENKISRRLSDDPNVLTYGDSAIVKFRFMHRPAYLRVGENILFTEGCIRSIGKIINLFPYIK